MSAIAEKDVRAMRCIKISLLLIVLNLGEKVLVTSEQCQLLLTKVLLGKCVVCVSRLVSRETGGDFLSCQ